MSLCSSLQSHLGINRLDLLIFCVPLEREMAMEALLLQTLCPKDADNPSALTNDIVVCGIMSYLDLVHPCKAELLQYHQDRTIVYEPRSTLFLTAEVIRSSDQLVEFYVHLFARTGTHRRVQRTYRLGPHHHSLQYTDMSFYY